MISIVICSRSGTISDTLKENIASSIGCPYELVIIKGGNSIFKAYNKGASLATNNNICFLHEDILFLNYGWGFALNKILLEPNIGLIGIAGSVFKSEVPSPWWLIDPSDFEYNFVVHSIKEQDETVYSECYQTEVLVIDGVLMGCKKDLFKSFSFDEINFSGFHFYDLDLSLQLYFSGYKNIVTNEINIVHNSSGFLNRSWMTNAVLFHKKWKKKLPFHIHFNQIPNQRQINLNLLKNWIILILKNNFDKKMLLSNFLRFLLKKPSLSDVKLILRIMLYDIFYKRV